MREHSRKHDLSSLLVLLLFAVFAVCILSVLLTSADTYRRLSDRDQGSYDHRTAAQYIVTKIRQADRQDTVSVRAFDGEDALRRASVACYAAEGIYPPNLDYLREHYGIQIDETRYMVVYDVFASNLMPDITVLEQMP